MLALDWFVVIEKEHYLEKEGEKGNKIQYIIST